MEGFLGAAYPWIKALHILAVISWMAGMLYLPRLFVYHADSQAGSDQSETFKVMERRLLRAIINPAMAVSWLAGLALATHLGVWTEAWFHAKLAMLVAMQVAHASFVHAWRAFAADTNSRSARYFRFMNEVPTLLMIAIVVLAVAKPF